MPLNLAWLSDKQALKFLLLDPSGEPTPVGCSECPFSEPAYRRDRTINEPYPHDPDEGYYACDLLGTVEVRSRLRGDAWVWGENPICQRLDWQTQAIRELEKARGA